jgi:hypothetical protein
MSCHPSHAKMKSKNRFLTLDSLLTLAVAASLVFKKHFSNGPEIQLRQPRTVKAVASSNSVDGFSHTSPTSRRSIYDNAFEDDNDSEMASLDGVSDTEHNDNSINSLQHASSNNFARTFLSNTRRRMSSGLALSYNFLKGASGRRRDST